MPSPLGHALAGFAVHTLTATSRGELYDVRRAALVTAAALAPDLDLLLRFVDGRNHHNQETHSLGFALLAALLAAALAGWRGWPSPARWGLACGIGWSSHLLLDYLNVDTHPPIGLLALWPLSAEYFKFPWPIFMDIGRTLDGHTVRHNAVAAAWEAVVLLPPLAWAWRSRRNRLGSGPWHAGSKASP
jgi:membrane-bound metal-dependent hydrolase YbcI (DUF457 family)